MEIDDSKPWDREAEEPIAWFDRFERFRLAGPSRSLLAVYNAERAAEGQKSARKVKPARDIPGAWKKNAEKWRWRTRAKAWDLGEQMRRRKEYEAASREDQEARIYLLKLTRSKLLKRLQELEPSAIRPEVLLNGIRMITQELRAEYVELPALDVDLSTLSDDEVRAIATG